MNSTTMKRDFRGRRGVWLLLALLLAAVPLVAATARIYVTNRGGTTISVIDPATNKVVDVIKGIESPEVVRFSPDGSLLYIANRSVDVLYVMDRKSGKYIKKVPLSGWANDAAVTSDGKLIVVCIRNTGTEALDVGALDIIDAKSLEKVKSIPVKPRRLGPPDLRTAEPNERILGGGFCDAQGSAKNHEPRRTQWVWPRVRGHQPRHWHIPGPQDSMGQQQAGQFCFRLLAP